MFADRVQQLIGSLTCWATPFACPVRSRKEYRWLVDWPRQLQTLSVRADAPRAARRAATIHLDPFLVCGKIHINGKGWRTRRGIGTIFLRGQSVTWQINFFCTLKVIEVFVKVMVACHAIQRSVVLRRFRDAQNAQ